jgi:Protein of unknown function (DUF4199)
MKRIVLIFGIISGVISSAMMLSMLLVLDRIGFDKGEILGYTMMVVSFLMVFFGIRSYRENVGGGKISFGRAFSIGILITIISCAFYVITWEFVYFKIAPDFADKYAAYVVDKARTSGASEQAIDAKIEEMKQFKAMYDKPLFNAAITFMEPLPVGLLITLISAVILRKKKGRQEAGPPHGAAAQLKAS